MFSSVLFWAEHERIKKEIIDRMYACLSVLVQKYSSSWIDVDCARYNNKNFSTLVRDDFRKMMMLVRRNHVHSCYCTDI